MKIKLLSIVAIIIVSTSLGGCFLRPYHINIEQGNILTPADAHKVHTGMTTSQVKKILGDPILTNIYADNRIVYIYTLQIGHKKMHKRHLIVYFQNNKVTAINTNVLSEPPLLYQIQ